MVPMHAINNSSNYTNEPYKYNQTSHPRGYQRVEDKQRANKPNQVADVTKHVSTVGPNGSSIKMATTRIRHDGEEAHYSVTQDIRLQRLGKLQAIGTKSKFGGTN